MRLFHCVSPSFGLVLTLFWAGCADDAGPTDSGNNGPDADGGQFGDGGTGDSGASDLGPADAGPFVWPVPTGPISITPSLDWKNRITDPPDEPFLSRPIGQARDEVRWVKFAVLLGDPSKVYFQDSVKYPFHYEFATERLDPFFGLSRDELDRRSLFERDQELILGAVLFAPRTDIEEYGIQLVRQDPYHPEMVRIVFDLVKSSVDTSSTAQAFYFPTFEQAASAQAHQAFLLGQGIEVGSPERWAPGNICYSGGWALGRLLAVAGSDLDRAFRAGEIGPSDIVLVDGVPADVPFVAGILSLSPSTPSSHVAIFAQSHHVPFVYLALEEERALARALTGRKVVLRGDTYGYGGAGRSCGVRLIQVEGTLDPALENEILSLKDPATLSIVPKETRGSISAPADGLTRADVRYFGGKASSFGLLRRQIPQNSPVAVALSFDLFDAFMAQTLPGGRTLSAEVESRLAGQVYPPNFAALSGTLLEIRNLILTSADFSTAQKTAITQALSGFDPAIKLRFRSSTNVEDDTELVGAGLYESHSGCLADDLDADLAGPSACNALQPEERGASFALRRVYASFYNDNAYLERLRRGVDERTVGMAVLVHRSYPDLDELANGVATVRRSRFSRNYTLVTQLGAVSVSNPHGGARPEVIDAYTAGGTVYLTRVEPSTLVRLGGTVMSWEEDYQLLVALLEQVTNNYPTSAEDFLLELEYKKIRPGELVIKQVRELPFPDVQPRIVPFLIDEPRRLCTFQGETGDVFANHRLKSRWSLSTQNLRLTTQALDTSFYGQSEITLVSGAATIQRSGLLPQLPGASHARMDGSVLDRFLIDDSLNARSFALYTQVPALVNELESPILTLLDLYLSVEVDYALPVPTIDWMGTSTTTHEFMQLGACPEDNRIDGRNLRVDYTLDGPNGLRVEIGLYYPPPPTGATAGYTAPLERWVGTTIRGLTSSPIVLRGYWSQTFRPGHHNFTEEFIFEPRLEEGIDPALVAELEAQQIRFLYVERTFDAPVFRVLGTSGQLRDF